MTAVPEKRGQAGQVLGMQITGVTDVVTKSNIFPMHSRIRDDLSNGEMSGYIIVGGPLKNTHATQNKTGPRRLIVSTSLRYSLRDQRTD